MTEADFLARVAPPAPGLSLGAFTRNVLGGMAAYVPNMRKKTRHKATMVAVYVAPPLRGSGVGRKLVERIVDHAAAQRVILQCSVAADNRPARGLYLALGFQPYGLEKDALLIDGRFFDEELLALDLRNRSA